MVFCYHGHPTAEDLSRRVASVEARLSWDSCTVTIDSGVKDQLNPQEKHRFSK